MQGVILAAGKGNRLLPVTHDRSKAMAPVAGKPMVERVVQLLVDNGIDDLILVVSQHDHEIQQHFQEQSSAGLAIRFVLQSERLGMAHALRLAASWIRDTFLLTACDNLVPAQHVADMLALHRDEAANATLSLMEIDPDDTDQTGVVEWHGGDIRRIVEKPKPQEAPSNISSLPLYIFSRRLLELLPRVQRSPRGEYELQDAIQMLIDHDGHVTGTLTPWRVQLTTVDDLLALNRHFLHQQRDRLAEPERMMGNAARLIPPYVIAEDTIIGSHCTLGPNVCIEHGCEIGPGAQIHDAVILRHTTIQEGRLVKNQVLSSFAEESG